VFGIPRYIAIAAIIIIVPIVGALVTAAAVWKHRAAAAQLAAKNERARADTTRTIALSAKDSARILGDSLRAVERLAIQERVRADLMDRALQRSTAALIGITASVARLAGSVQSSGDVRSSAGDSVRTAEFHERREPFTLAAKAALPRFGRASLSYEIDVDPARVKLKVGCEKRKRGDLARAATTSAVGPKWLTISLDSVQQDPEVCANAGASGGASFVQFRPGIAFGYGATMAKGRALDGPPADSARKWQLIRGPTISAGVTITLGK
jgi:hypothetical protein